MNKAYGVEQAIELYEVVMKMQLGLLLVMLVSFASPVLADSSNPTVGETPTAQVDHRGTQCKYQKLINSVDQSLASSGDASGIRSTGARSAQ